MKTEVEKRMMAFAVPVSVATAVETAAAQDMASASHVIRQAIVKDLRERGLLPGQLAWVGDGDKLRQRVNAQLEGNDV